MIELPPDRRAHQTWLHSLTTVPDNGIAVDLGCGRGGDLGHLAMRHGARGIRFIGADRVGDVETSPGGADPRIAFRCADLDTHLPFDDGSLGLVYSHNLLECLSDPEAFAREVARVLRPGGQAVIAHWDWDTQLFDGADKSAVRRLVAAFADRRQAWMHHADGWMGRRLLGGTTLKSGPIVISDSKLPDVQTHGPVLLLGLDRIRDRVVFLSYSTGMICIGPATRR